MSDTAEQLSDLFDEVQTEAGIEAPVEQVELLTPEEYEQQILDLINGEDDPLGLNPDADLLVERFSVLTRDKEEMCRDIDEVISKHTVFLNKAKEKRKELTEKIDEGMAELEEQIRELVLENRTDAAAGGIAFGYSERDGADYKKMLRDSKKSPFLAKLLEPYLTVTPICSKRKTKSE